MNSEIALIIAGFLFWFIIATNIASGRFGYRTIDEITPEAKLQEIKNSPQKFKTGVFLILIEHTSIIVLAAILFVAFSSYNVVLALIWLISRTAEGLIQIYYKRFYWGLLCLARQYTGTRSGNSKELLNRASIILKTKSVSFSAAQILFSIGTLAYSILFVAYGVLPLFIGWLGIIAGFLYGLGNWLTPLNPKFKFILYPGALLVLVFEAILGGWLIFAHIAV
jgi:hypothetical protein